jgi:hypothetical protein
VEGHCCYYCGGRIRLSKKTLLSTAQRLVKKALKGYEDTLFWHTRRTWDDHSEILIREKDTYGGTNVIIATARLESALKGDVICRGKRKSEFLTFSPSALRFRFHVILKSRWLDHNRSHSTRYHHILARPILYRPHIIHEIETRKP